MRVLSIPDTGSTGNSLVSTSVPRGAKSRKETVVPFHHQSVYEHNLDLLLVNLPPRQVVRTWIA